MVATHCTTAATTAPLTAPTTADRPAPVNRTVRTLVACFLATDATDLTEAVNDQLAAIEDAGGAVVSVSYAAAAVMAPEILVIEDRLSALIIYRAGRPA